MIMRHWYIHGICGARRMLVCLWMLAVFIIISTARNQFSFAKDFFHQVSLALLANCSETLVQKPIIFDNCLAEIKVRHKIYLAVPFS
jgi:hypothetical protein